MIISSSRRAFLAFFPALLTALVFAPPSARAGGPDPAEPAYRLDVKMEPYRATPGKEMTLTIAVVAREGDRAVTEFGDLHTEPLHLYLVRADLGLFYRLDPKANADGTFTQTFSFPDAGEWRLFADVTPRGATGAQTVTAKINVDGVRPFHPPIFPQSNPVTAREAGMTLTLQTPRLTSGGTEARPIVFALADMQGHEVTDLQIWHGSLAHLIFIDRDAKTFVHAFTDDSDPRNGRTSTLAFAVRFPKSGIYKGWLQAERGGQVVTFPFTVRVSDE